MMLLGCAATAGAQAFDIPPVPSAALSAPSRLVFNFDKRLDRYQVTDRRMLDASRSVFTFIDKSGLLLRADGKYEFASKRTHKEYVNLCPGGNFGDQPAPGGFCTGFLAGPDTGVTAGHCVENDELDNFCSKYYIIFDYYMEDASTPRTVFDPSQVYTCSSLVKREYDDNGDFTVLKLSRPAADRPVLKVRAEGKIDDGAKLSAVGYPKGLPQKFVMNFSVLDNSGPLYFATDMDAFHGNSGGSVFNTATMEVEGLVIMMDGNIEGDGDYVKDPSGCNKLFITDPSSSRMMIERSAAFSPLLGK